MQAKRDRSRASYRPRWFRKVVRSSQIFIVDEMHTDSKTDPTNCFDVSAWLSLRLRENAAPKEARVVAERMRRGSTVVTTGKIGRRATASCRKQRRHSRTNNADCVRHNSRVTCCCNEQYVMH
jgi:hypothetical protein